MNYRQRVALTRLSARYKVPFDPNTFEEHPFDLPPGYVCGWVGPIYVGCSPEGDISS